MNKRIFIIATFFLVVLSQYILADITLTNISTGVTDSNGNADSNPSGVVFVTNTSGNITNIYKYATDAATGCRVYDNTTSQYVGGLNGTFSGATCSQRFEIIAGRTYFIFGYGGAVRYGTLTIPTQTLIGNFTNTVYCNANPCTGYYYDTNARRVKSFEFENTSNQLTVFTVNNMVDNVNINGFCIKYENSSKISSICNSTGNSIAININGTFNLTFYSIGSGDNTTQSYFNVTRQNINIFNGNSVSGNTSQGYFNVTIRRYILNNTIENFNVTNNVTLNSTTVYSAVVPAKLGNNALRFDVLGNITLYYNCTLSTLYAIEQCNATGIYDSLIYIGVKFTNGTVVNSFSINFSNVDKLYNTTNGTSIIPSLVGYAGTFQANGSTFANINGIITPNSTPFYYNFTAYAVDTFFISFFNESTNTKLTNTTVFLNVISESGSTNYTIINSSINISFLIPDDYILQYRMYNQTTWRDYYTTLAENSYSIMNLYAIEDEISNIYSATIIDESTTPINNATVSLMRFYVTNNTYNVVEMAHTDTNGIAVFRVVPNTIYYKLHIQYKNRDYFTSPAKLITSANTYTINLKGNPLESFIGMQNVYRALTFNNNTNTYTFVWSDTTNLVSRSCLIVEQITRNGNTMISNQCSNGASGSIIYTITDTNNTSYRAIGTIDTNTEYSEYNTGWLTSSYLQTGIASFGLVGIFIILIVSITIMFVGNESGTDTMILASLIGFLGLGALGIAVGSWAVIFPMIVLVIIIIYKTRT